jgi:HTH-type transcriptional regulator, competence development regulator
MLSNLAAGPDGPLDVWRGWDSRPMTEPRPDDTLGAVLRAARAASGLSLRDVERRTGIRNAHLSQIETDTIAKPEMAILWDLASLYGVDFARLLALAGHVGGRETSASQRRRTTVALRALSRLSPGDQEEALRFMAELKARRDDG